MPIFNAKIAFFAFSLFFVRCYAGDAAKIEGDIEGQEAKTRVLNTGFYTQDWTTTTEETTTEDIEEIQRQERLKKLEEEDEAAEIAEEIDLRARKMKEIEEQALRGNTIGAAAAANPIITAKCSGQINHFANAKSSKVPITANSAICNAHNKYTQCVFRSIKNAETAKKMIAPISKTYAVCAGISAGLSCFNWLSLLFMAVGLQLCQLKMSV